jgi:hypothetical protein
VYLDGTSQGTTAGLTFSVAAACGTTHTVSVDAFDAAGNHSTRASVTGSTAACSGGSTAQVFVSTTGNDSTCVRLDASHPCRSFNTAYRVAQPGDIVEVAAGTYPTQEIDQDTSKNSATSMVTFQPASGASVTINGSLSIGNGQGTAAASWVTVKNMAVTSDTQAFTPGKNIEFDNIDGGDFYLRGVQNVLVNGGDWGPCNSSAIGNAADACSSPAKIDSPSGGEQANNNITIQNANFHDFLITRSGDHFECLDVWGGANVTVQNSKFWNCEIYDISVAPGAGACVGMPNLTIQNNWFGRSENQGGAARISAVELDTRCVGFSNAVVRFNSFASGQGMDLEAGTTGSGLSAVGNIFGIGASSNCITGVAYSYNVWQSGSCGTGDVNTGNAAPPYVNGSDGAAMDYHLAGAAGSTVADNLVTPTTAPYNLATDIFGTPRNAPRDAGSVER